MYNIAVNIVVELFNNGVGVTVKSVYLVERLHRGLLIIVLILRVYIYNS